MNFNMIKKKKAPDGAFFMILNNLMWRLIKLSNEKGVINHPLHVQMMWLVVY